MSFQLTAISTSVTRAVQIFTRKDKVLNGQNITYLSLFYSGLDERQYFSVKISILLPLFQIIHKFLNSVVGLFLLPKIQDLRYPTVPRDSLDCFYVKKSKRSYRIVMFLYLFVSQSFCSQGCLPLGSGGSASGSGEVCL